MLHNQYRRLQSLIAARIEALLQLTPWFPRINLSASWRGMCIAVSELCTVMVYGLVRRSILFVVFDLQVRKCRCMTA